LRVSPLVCMSLRSLIVGVGSRVCVCVCVRVSVCVCVCEQVHKYDAAVTRAWNIVEEGSVSRTPAFNCVREESESY